MITADAFDSKSFPIAVISYKALEKAFATAINQSGKFAGWEKYGYNLKIHPEVFGPRD